MASRMTKSPPSLIARVAAKLRASGIDAKAARRLKMDIISEAELASHHLPQAQGLRIPYFNIAGDATDFFRVRYMEDMRSGFEIAAGAKPLRYVQPPGSLNEIYLPPVVDWNDIARDAKIPLLITEGEFKAACATLNGYPCVGLGGVWCFRSAANSMSAIPSMSWIDWSDRLVTIIFDSDAASNPDIARAEHALATLLTNFGAELFIARMPKLKGMDKTGIDDLIVAQGADSLTDIIANASEFAASHALHELNGEVIYVRSPGLIVKLDENLRMMPRAFVDHAYATRSYSETLLVGTASKLVTKFTAKEWLKWPRRAEVGCITYRPGAERIASDALNVWAGWRVAPVAGNAQPWQDLIAYLFQDDHPAGKWFEQWCAYPLQHPSAKLYSASVLWSIKTGIGKSLIGASLGRVYGRNYELIREEDLTANHNEWAENKQFVMVDDVNGKSNRVNADFLKSMITRDMLRLNPKYIPSYSIPDCINYLFTSNQPDAFFIEDYDRRFFIHEITAPPLPQAFYNKYADWIGSDEGAAALFAHLLTIDTSDFNPKGPALATVSKRAMIDDSRSDLAMWVAKLKSDPDRVLLKSGEPITYNLWRAEDLLKVYDALGKTTVTTNGMARELKRADFPRLARGAQCPTHLGSCRLYAVRDPQHYIYCTGAEVGAAYDKEREEAQGFLVPKAPKPMGYDLNRTREAERGKAISAGRRSKL